MKLKKIVELGKKSGHTVRTRNQRKAAITFVI